MDHVFIVIVYDENIGETLIFKTGTIDDELLVSTINDGAIIIDTMVNKKLVGFDLSTRELHWEDINEL
jgi:hypothetical protein